jgi:DNA polymerase
MNVMLERLRDERAPGATFAIANICWIDFESRGRLPITVGTDRYSDNADAILLAWAIGDDPVQVESVDDFDSGPLRWPDMPKPLRDFFARAAVGRGVFCAHNANFDRAIWNNSTFGFPTLDPWMLIDTRVQATASGLPAALEHAAKYAGADILKDKAGKELIKQFTQPDKSSATPQSHPDDWQAFIGYAACDVAAMRDLFKHTRQLPLAEWKEYWAAENVNDGGVAIDLPLVEAAAMMAREDRWLSATELQELTDGQVKTVDMVQRMVAWLYAILPADGRAILVKTEEVVDLETGEVTKPQKNSLERDRVVKLLAYLQTLQPLSDRLKAAERVLQIRLYGGSKTPAKFAKMAQQQVDGVIRGQYVFNGAGQTGRFSARGIGVHNLMRDSFDHEIDAIDALVGGADAATFAALGDDTPISRKLSLLIRPSLVARPGDALVWGDWSNIEARITPWLAKDPEADRRLDIFRAVDAGREKYDIYTRTTAALLERSVEEIDDKLRQRGKVVELACTFGGGTNALLSMAASYGMHLSEEDAKSAVDRWREDNPWAPRFWKKLWDAAIIALTQPHQFFEVGRVGYLFLPEYLAGSLMCRLPSGRFLTYRKIKWEMVEEVDDDGLITNVRRELMFSRDMGRVKLWPGLFCENITQAAAADLLRGTIRRLEEYPGLPLWMPTVLHTHDEIVVEAEEARASEAAAVLRQMMSNGFDWTAGLPIAAEAKVARWYTKNKQSIGL